MSDDTRRGREAARLMVEAQQIRRRQLAAMARDYEGVRDRLESAYRGAVGGINSRIDDIMARLAANFETMSREEYAAAVWLADDLKAFRAAVARDLEAVAGVVRDGAAGLERRGAEAGVRGGVAALRSGGVRMAFNPATLENIQAGIGYVDGAAFRSAVGRYGEYHAEKIADTILSAVSTYTNPRTTAAAIDQYLQRAPLADAERLARTTQIYSYRQGTRGIYEAAEVREWIWSANIGSPRTCAGCIAMHGTRHPIEQVLNDHHNGRCAMVPVTPTWEALGEAGGRDGIFQTGAAWFERQDASEQARVLGEALYAAYATGRVSFTPEVMTTEYRNPIFGVMRRKATNNEIFARSGI